MSMRAYSLMTESPVIAGNQRVSDSFFESEPFLRGSVLRAAFAKLIAFSCPLPEQVRSGGGGFFWIEQKSEADCADCRYAEICRRFGEMRFSFACLRGTFPAPITARVCKNAGCAHPVQDILIPSDDPILSCAVCGGRMEGLRGFVSLPGADGRCRAGRVRTERSSHISVDAESLTARSRSVYSVQAIAAGQELAAAIDDCGTGLAACFDTVYAGKYTSGGFGKLRLREIPVKAEPLAERIARFRQSAGDPALLSVLFLSDMRIPVPAGMQLILHEWERILFGGGELPFTLEKIFTETALYSGYNTAREWGKWRDPAPDLLVRMGTSLLLRVRSGKDAEAAALLERLEAEGLGERRGDGYGQIAVCHPLHAIGRSRRNAE